MDITVAQQCLREHENTLLTTWRQDGHLHMSPVTVGPDAAGRAIISSRATAYKVRNLRRDPRAALCVFVEVFTGPWVQIEGTAEVLTLSEAMEPLVDSYRRLAGEHPDWDDDRRAMTADQRALIRITIERAGPDRQGEKGQKCCRAVDVLACVTGRDDAHALPPWRGMRESHPMGDQPL
jgi:PPOX class probable F420-dependent enzyme